MTTEVSTKQDQWRKLFGCLMGNQAAWIADPTRFVMLAEKGG